MREKYRDPAKRFIGRLCIIQPTTHSHPDNRAQSERYISNESCCMCVAANAEKFNARNLADPTRLKAIRGPRAKSEPMTKAQVLEARKLQRRSWVAKDPASVKAYQKEYHAKKRIENPDQFDKYRQTQVDRGHTGPYGKDKLLPLPPRYMKKTEAWDTTGWDNNGNG
jgi:hypothetical protein